jgi:RNA polymerase sigma-70 factor, ECF subfamily
VPELAGERWDWRRLHAVALREARRVLDDADAQDAAQEALVRAWRRAHTCSGSDPAHWIKTIARREALRIVARRRDERQPDEVEVGEVPAHGSATDCRADVASSLALLSPAERQALFLRYWAGKSDRQIAVMLGAPIGTIKVRIHRAQKKLAGRLAAGR